MLKINLKASVAHMAENGNGTVETTNVSAATSGTSLGVKAASNADFTAALREGIDAKETTARGPLIVMQTIMDLYTPEEMSLFPVPNSTQKDHANLYDRYERWGTNPDTGGKKKIKGSFYADFFAAQPAGKEAQSALDGIALAHKKDAKAPGEYLKMNPVARESMRRRWNGRKTTGIALIKRAIALYQQIVAVNELAHCEVDFVKDPADEDKLANTTVPIIVRNPDGKKAATDWETFSVPQFLALDPSEAADKGGTVEALKATSGKGRKDPGDDEAPGWKDVDTAIAQLGNLSAFFEETDNVQSLYTALEKADMDEEVLSIGRAYWDMHRLYMRIQTKYERLDKARIAAEKAAAAA